MSRTLTDLSYCTMKFNPKLIFSLQSPQGSSLGRFNYQWLMRVFLMDHFLSTGLWWNKGISQGAMEPLLWWQASWRMGVPISSDKTEMSEVKLIALDLVKQKPSLQAYQISRKNSACGALIKMLWLTQLWSTTPRKCAFTLHSLYELCTTHRCHALTLQFWALKF